jgi:two-component system, OmpR family, phosphate regulon sensor histidine kinase PhoR
MKSDTSRLGATRLISTTKRYATRVKLGAVAFGGHLTQTFKAVTTPTAGKARGRSNSRNQARNQATEAAWHAIIDAIPSAAIALDASGIVCHHNQAASELYPKVTSGRPISHVSRNPEFMNAVEKIFTSTESISVELIERVPVERRFFATLTNIDPHDDAPNLPKALITFRDTSEQDKLIQMRTDFIANASHELRTPLASLRGFIETLQGPARDDPQARERFLGMMATQASRMSRLIDDLLSLSRAEMRVHLPPRGSVDLNETTAYAIQTLDQLAASAGVTVTFLTLPTPALIRGERDEIVQVLQNLLQNAIKYGRDKGTITIQLTRSPVIGPAREQAHERFTISVTDEGQGIAPHHLPRLTERFYRANASTSREKGGTGLGLAIVKHIVNRHRGELKIQSTVDKGSTFSVVFDVLVTHRASASAAIEKTAVKTDSNTVIK